MKGEVLKIIFRDNMAFLTDEIALDFYQVDFDNDKTLRFKSTAFWTVHVINYSEAENRIFVEVLTYEKGETEFGKNQIELTGTLITIEKVAFKSINVGALYNSLNGSGTFRMSHPKEEVVIRRETPTIIQSEPIKKIHNEKFTFPLKKVIFSDGCVVFEKKLTSFRDPIKFTIKNEHILKEFDSIKNYFSNVLNTKEIQVEVCITTNDGKIDTVAKSVVIDKIDQNTIDEVRLQYIKETRNKVSNTQNQSFTFEEYSDAFAYDNFSLKEFFDDGNQFLESLIQNSDSIHYNHLRFLSSKHSHEIMKLRFVQKPFSFLFFLSGIKKYYIVWETLDTKEATYIWSISKDKFIPSQTIVNIDNTIKLIKIEGRNEYINRTEENFIRINHYYSDKENGFKNWKDDIEEIIC